MSFDFCASNKTDTNRNNIEIGVTQCVSFYSSVIGQFVFELLNSKPVFYLLGCGC